MTPTRRRCLRRIGGGSALLVGGAGCLGRGSSGGDAGGTRPSGTGGPGVTVVSVDGTDDLPVVPSVEVVREAATEESPPRLRTVLENTGDERVTVGEGRAVHLEYVSDGSDALVFLPSDGEYPAEPGCWRLTDGVAVTAEYRTFEIDAGASSGRSVDLYATPGEDACLPVGEYRFETPVSIGGPDSEGGPSGQWGLTLLLE
ncbi:hypothetical protein [Halorubrum lipolyticum]|uniref:Uncharacterized protein n=1 Tax=Halorubrum lipolyticum DSM 21995 TaxID=1227482 RepID=M0P3J3_9EURY|nr:hypothetical protein [Halorubrum lipolyticum]EMA64727.1 hypothetical protein C469_00685 [Halorubrum lipolyticum DSM 21995]